MSSLLSLAPGHQAGAGNPIGHGELRVAAACGFGDRREPSQRLAEAVKLVAAARDRGATPDLQYVLIEVAAVAMDWAATSRLAAVSRTPQGTR
jgi:hypothetical protein